MVGVDTLDEGHGLRQDGDIALDDALDHIADREFATTESVAFQVGIDDTLLFDATVDLESGVLGTIFGMIHSF